MIATQFGELLKLLSSNGIEFVVVGGVAATAHGAIRGTLDLDVVYNRTPENLARIVSALRVHAPYPRGAPDGLPFQWDERTLRFGVNFTLRTDLGFIDLLGEITGGGTYADLRPLAISMTIYGQSCLCIDLDHLIRVKRAAARTKDFLAIAELELLLEEKKLLVDDPKKPDA
jgi:predicted nucleotidyltransferase